MRQESVTGSSPSERLVKNIRRATRKQYSAEGKIRIVLDGLRGESSIAELCRRASNPRNGMPAPRPGSCDLARKALSTPCAMLDRSACPAAAHALLKQPDEKAGGPARQQEQQASDGERLDIAEVIAA